MLKSENHRNVTIVTHLWRSYETAARTFAETLLYKRHIEFHRKSQNRAQIIHFPCENQHFLTFWWFSWAPWGPERRRRGFQKRKKGFPGTFLRSVPPNWLFGKFPAFTRVSRCLKTRYWTDRKPLCICPRFRGLRCHRSPWLAVYWPPRGGGGIACMSIDLRNTAPPGSYSKTQTKKSPPLQTSPE